MIGAEHLTIALGGRTVLDDVSFEIGAGEFIGVLGPNGSGKTTLMRAILGLVPPLRGELRVFGRAAGRGNPAIGYMPQAGGTAGSHLRGWDVVAGTAGGHRWGRPLLGAAERATAVRAIELVGAETLARRRLGTLSGGERQRLLLAQAVLGAPRLLLLDEPLISLDPGHQDTVVRLVRRIQRELGITVLFSAHELNPLLPVMDRVLYLGGGAAALGTVADVITGPVLSRLYGTGIEVVRAGGRLFVMSGAHDMEGGAAHRHEHDHAGHAHA